MSKIAEDCNGNPKLGENVTIPTVAPEGKSFPVPSDHVPGSTIPSDYLPQTGQDRPEGR